MSAIHVTDLLIDYIHHELAAEDDALVYAHLRDCADCCREYRAELAVTEALRGAAGAEEADMPATIPARVRHRVLAPERSRFEFRAFWRPAAMLATAAVLALIVLLALPLNHPTAARSVDAAYYFEAHAAQEADNPFGDHTTGSAAIESSMLESGAGSVADHLAPGYEAAALLTSLR
jgi:predicted anti-sigma-YlaC factor YlaD